MFQKHERYQQQNFNSIFQFVSKFVVSRSPPLRCRPSIRNFPSLIAMCPWAPALHQVPLLSTKAVKPKSPVTDTPPGSPASTGLEQLETKRILYMKGASLEIIPPAKEDGHINALFFIYPVVSAFLLSW